MSSTYSSDEARRVPGQSPTEALAARYRHLFVLPSKGTLLIFNLAAAALLSVAEAGGRPSLALTGATLLAVPLIPYAIFLTSKAIDPATVATFRRSLAVTLAGTALWLVCAGAGLAYSSLFQSGLALGNAIVFGSFLCAGFETLVINGAFVERTTASVLLGSLQPASTIAAFLLAGGAGYSSYAAVPGFFAFIPFPLFVVSLKRKRTSRGHGALKLFQTFMKTWANNDASELEAIIASHAEKAQVSSKVLRFQSQEGDLFVVLPGVHPGPFYPVGSYNLPGLISQAFEGSGQVLTLHRPGGHERNLATNADAKDYSKTLRDFAVNLSPSGEKVKVRGPAVTRIGNATATLCAFKEDLLLTVSFAPHGSDDLELGFENRLAVLASGEGFDIGVVDAHNSIDNARDAPDLDDPRWRQSIQNLKRFEPVEFKMGFARSREHDLPSANDITPNGLGLLVLETSKTKWVLALADANNAVRDLRLTVSDALESSGYKLLEFCTSDSHDLAARGLTVNRGYKALGEATSIYNIANTTVKLAKLAESRLASCRFAAGTITSEVSLFGAAAPDEFAAITRGSSAFAKRYAKFVTFGLIALLLLSLVI